MSFYNGLSLLIFHPDEYQAEYGCANISTNSASISSNTHSILSIVQLILALISEILYALCMYSIWKHLHLSCYKILFYIGIVDMLGLVVGAILCSLMGLTGATFCDFPLTQYLTGGLAMAFWFAETTSELILAFNRCLELLLPDIGALLFKEGRTWLLMGFPTAYAVFSWLFTRPVMFSTTKFAFFFSPYEDYNVTTASSIYSNMMHTFNNTLVSCVLCTTYALFCLLWVGRMLKMIAITKTSTTVPNNGNNLRKGIGGQSNKYNGGAKNGAGSGSSIAVQMTFLQVVFISFFNACAAGLGVYMEHFVIYPEMIVAAQLTYVLTHAAPPFIYLACNRTIRADIRALLSGHNRTSVEVLARHNDGLITGLIAPTHTQSVGIVHAVRSRDAAVVVQPPIIVAQVTTTTTDQLSILSNNVPLFRRQISVASGRDASSEVG